MQHKHDHSPESKPAPEEPGAGLQEGATRTIRGAPGGTQPPASTGDTDGAMRMPFERDQSSDSSADRPRAVIKQAKKDLDAGLVNTDLRGSPGQDAEQQRKLLDAEKARSRPDGAAEPKE